MPDYPNGPGHDPNLPYGLGAWIPPKEVKEQQGRYKIKHFIPETGRTKAFYKPPDCQDQASTGTCVGQCMRHYERGEPNPDPTQPGELEPVTSLDPIKWPSIGLYFGAQENDPWPGGEYPGASPQYEGSSLSGAAKWMQTNNVIQGGYGWVENPDDVFNYVLNVGPLMFASLWTYGMFNPDGNGFIHPTGKLAGGHAYFMWGADVTVSDPVAFFLQSWGRWGQENQQFTDVNGKPFTVPTGLFKIRKSEMPALFADHDAEGFAPIKVAQPAPPPPPSPAEYYPELPRYGYANVNRFKREHVETYRRQDIGHFTPKP